MTTLPGNLTSPRAGPILADWHGPILFGPPHAREDRWPAPDERLSLYHTYDGEAFAVDADGDRYRAVFDVVRLDLTRAEVRGHALRWLGRHYGLDVGIGCPGWSRFGGASPVWCLHTAKIDLWFASGGRSAVDRCATNIFDVPGISAITDPLEALVAACLHAAGVSR